MACCPDGKSYRRLNAIHLLLIGVAYDLVLRNCGCGERCLRLWISRFNEQGIDGLTYRPRNGRPRKLTAADIESEILPVVDDPTLPANSTGPLSNSAAGFASKNPSTSPTAPSSVIFTNTTTPAAFHAPSRSHPIRTNGR